MNARTSKTRRRIYSGAVALTLILAAAGFAVRATLDAPESRWHVEAPEARVAALIELLRGSDTERRRESLQKLVQMGRLARAAIPSVQNLLEDRRNDPELRGEAAIALAVLGGPEKESVARLQTALTDPHEEVRELCALSLGLLGNTADSASNALEPLTSDPHPGVRSAAVYAAAKVRPTPDNVAAVRRMLSDANARARFMALRTLRELGPEFVSDVAPIELALSSSDPGAVTEAIRILHALGPRAATAESALMRLFEQGDFAEPALRALRSIDASGQANFELLVGCLKTCPSAKSRRLAALSLAERPEKLETTTSHLLAAIEDEDEGVRLSALDSVGKLRPAYSRVRSALCTAIVRGSSATSWKALEVVASFGTASLADLETLLGDSSARVRAQAAFALSRLGRDAAPAKQALISALRDADSSVRAQADLALKRIAERS